MDDFHEDGHTMFLFKTLVTVCHSTLHYISENYTPGGRSGYGSFGHGRENYSGGVKNTHKRFDGNDYSGEYRM
jgi:hypothetical protein